MGKQGFRDISSDPFVYLESVSGESVALGIDDTDDNFKISVSAVAGANPSGTATLDIDTATNNTILSCGTLDIDATGVLQINSSGGVISIGNDAVAQNIDIGNGAVASTISIGSVAADKTIDIGFGLANMGIRIGVANGTSSVAIESGTGGVSVNSVGGSVSLTGSTGAIIDSAAGTIGVGSQNSDNPVNIGTLATAGRTVTIGNGTGTTSVVVNVGTGALNLGTTATVHTSTLGSITGASSTVVQSGTGALNVTSTNGALTINSGTGALSISNDAVNTTVTIATGAGVKTTTLGSTNTTSVTTVACGTGGANFGASANAHTTTLGSTTGTSTTTVDCGTGGLNLGTSASVHTTTMGSNTGASSTIIRAGTGALTVTTLNGPLTIDSNNGTVTLDSGSGALNISTDPAATTVNIGTGGATKTINLGTGASPRVITIGSTDTTSSVDINIGTGDFDITSATGLLTRQLDTGEMTQPLQPAFFAQLASDDANVTGNGATYLLGTNVAFTEIFDQGGDFNTNGVFTAPVTGRYLLTGGVRTLGTVGTSGFFACLTSNRVLLFYDINPAAVADAGASTQYVGSCLCDMDAGDTAQLRLQITGGAGNTVDLDGIATDAHTFFSGFLAC
jgi:hypothetical protein